MTRLHRVAINPDLDITEKPELHPPLDPPGKGFTTSMRCLLTSRF
jgi:hypothetical protein